MDGLVLTVRKATWGAPTKLREVFAYLRKPGRQKNTGFPFRRDRRESRNTSVWPFIHQAVMECRM